MYLKDRESAAYLLLDKLKQYKGMNPLVAGIPRGAMSMAKIIADGLGGELTAVLVHKIPSPENKEFAIGSVGISGHIHRDPYVYEYGIPDTYIDATALEQLDVLKKRKEQYKLGTPEYKDRIVLIVDDGIATGATTKCAIHEVQAQKPRKIVVVAAVTSVEAASEIRPLVDALIVLDRPRNFYSVGQFFAHFPQVTDEEVVRILRREDSSQSQFY